MIFDFFFNKKRKKLKTNVETLLCNKSNFAATEAYKLLRTNLVFTLPDEKKCRIIGITSSVRGETKSTTAINLSYVVAEAGRRVLLIDADLRLPTVSKKLGLPATPGLSETLINPQGEVVGVIKMERENWHILPAGSIPPNPSELLGSAQMQALLEKLSDEYDVIVVDLPPVNIVSDAVTISPMLSGMVVVVRANYTRRRELNKCLKSLDFANAKVLGMIVTDKPRSGRLYMKYRRYGKSGDYNSSYSSYGYYYGHPSKNKALEETIDNE